MLYDFNFFSILSKHIPGHADNVALSWDNGQFTYSQLFTETHQLALGLKALGLKQSDRIAILANNVPNYLPLLLAASFIGIINVLLNRRLSQAELDYIIKDTEPKLIFTDEDNRSLAREVKQKQTMILSVKDPDLKKRGNERIVPAKSDQPFVIIHTAAVQGNPLGAVLSQKNLIAANLQLMARVPLNPVDRYLNILPLYHIMGLNLALSTLQCGGQNVLMPTFVPEKAIQVIEEQQVSILGSFPPILKNILDKTTKQDSLSSLKIVLGVEQEETINALHRKTRAIFFPIYGQTETSGLICFSPYQEAPGSAGRPGDLTLLKILDEDDQELAANKIGEIAIQGPLVFQGYWNKQDETRHTFRNHWHHTGDLGKIDKNGFLYFAGRKPEKELIKSGGENVFPAEVERVILQLPEIKETCVIGVPDPKFGEGIKAICVLQPGAQLSKQDLITFVSSKIAAYKKPRYIEFVSQLPKTKEGNINRAQVKAKFSRI